MIRIIVGSVLALFALTSAANEYPEAPDQNRGIRDLIADLSALDPAVRARAACDIRERGDDAADAMPPLTAMLVCGARRPLRLAKSATHGQSPD